MRVNKTSIIYTITSNYKQVNLELSPLFQKIIAIIDISQYQEWIQQSMHTQYLIKIHQNTIKFEYQTILMQSGHQQLIKIIHNMLNEFVAYQIGYPQIYEPQMEAIQDQLDNPDNIYFTPVVFSNNLYTTIVYFHYQFSERQQLQHTINKLKQFREELLIYPIKDQFKEKIDLTSNKDLKIFMQAFTQFYSPSIVTYIDKHLHKIGMKASIIISQIDYFVKEEQEKLKQKKIDLSGLNASGGLIFAIAGYQQSFCKLHTFLQKWLQKLITTVVQVQRIQCCRKQNVEQYFRSHYSNSYAVLLQPSKNSKQERILVFDPPKFANIELQNFFKTAKRIITGLQFPNFDFKILNEFWNMFISDNQPKLQVVSLNEDYLIVNCTKGQQIWLRQRIRRFLQNYSFNQNKVTIFSNPFQISLFQTIYAKKITIKNAKFYIQDKCLFLKCFDKDKELVDKQICDIYQQMKKQLVFVPISKSLTIKRPYFRQQKAEQWQAMECLEWQQFKIDDKITINIRSFASLSTNQQQCIFVIQNLKDSYQLIQILKEEGSTTYQKRIEDNPVLGFSLRYCKYMNNITTCKIRIGNERDKRWLKKIKETFQELIENHGVSRHMKFMFHQYSQEAIQNVVPMIINSIHSSYQLRVQSKIKQVTFFISLREANSLRSAVQKGMRSAKQKNINITKICNFYLQISDIQKIITYGYCTFKYYQNETTLEASSLNSYIFYTEKIKNKKTPIFLAQLKQKRENKQCEYLVSCFNNTAYKINHFRDTIVKIALNERLSKIKSIIKKYFVASQYFVINGNNEGTYFCDRLFYTSPAQEHYNKLEKATMQVQNQRITLQEKLYQQYSIIKNEFISLKKIETHPSKVAELKSLLKTTSLK